QNDCKNLIIGIWSDSQLTATNGINVGQCSLTDGAEVQDWSPQPYALELLKVRRFYQKSFLVDVAPQQNAGLGTGEYRAIAGKATAAAEFIPIQYPQEFRVPPTITLYNPAAANTQVRDVTAGGDCSASSPTSSSATNTYISTTGNAGTAVGNILAINWSADAEI